MAANIGLALVVTLSQAGEPTLPYPIVDTAQERTLNNTREIRYPDAGEAFYGQDAQYQGRTPAYQDNGDGRVSAAEVDGPADHFRVLDRNHDGYLEDNEAPRMSPRRRGLADKGNP